jgi:pimeloyl-ACP methyl ester carboxylesterase
MQKILALSAVLAIIVLAAATAIGWYYSNELRDGALIAKRGLPRADLVVESVSAGSITLRATDTADRVHGFWRLPGHWGLAWDDGYGRVDEILTLTEDRVTRRFSASRGIAEAGDAAWIDGPSFEGDPLTARGLSFSNVIFESELGPLGAWRLEGTGDNWAIFAHGKDQTRRDALRFLPPYARTGVSMLVIQYRNDEGVAPSASGYYDYGESEWRDVEAAVRYALAHGAKKIALSGSSLGGAIVLSFLYRSDLADHVRAVVLDAPMLDLSDTVDFGAERRGLLPAITWVGKTASALRFGFDWQNRNYLRQADRLTVPILLFHGDADRDIHVRTSDQLAAARSDIVTYVRVAGGTHVGSWNVDPEAYEQKVVNFLERVLRP